MAHGPLVEVSTLILHVQAYNDSFEQDFAKIYSFNMIVGKCVNICKMMMICVKKNFDNYHYLNL